MKVFNTIPQDDDYVRIVRSSERLRAYTPMELFRLFFKDELRAATDKSEPETQGWAMVAQNKLAQELWPTLPEECKNAWKGFAERHCCEMKEEKKKGRNTWVYQSVFSFIADTTLTTSCRIKSFHRKVQNLVKFVKDNMPGWNMHLQMGGPVKHQHRVAFVTYVHSWSILANAKSVYTHL